MVSRKAGTLCGIHSLEIEDGDEQTAILFLGWSLAESMADSFQQVCRCTETVVRLNTLFLDFTTGWSLIVQHSPEKMGVSVKI